MLHFFYFSMSRLRSARGGNVAVEFSMIAPVFFTLMFGVIEFGRLMWTESALNFAVGEAARCASVTPSTCGTAAQIASYAAGKVTALNIAAATFTATKPTCGHQVSASYAYQFILTKLYPYSLTLTASACFP